MLPNRQVHALDERRVDLAAVHGEHLLDRLKRAEHHAVVHPHEATRCVVLITCA